MSLDDFWLTGQILSLLILGCGAWLSAHYLIHAAPAGRPEPERAPSLQPHSEPTGAAERRRSERRAGPSSIRLVIHDRRRHERRRSGHLQAARG